MLAWSMFSPHYSHNCFSIKALHCKHGHINILSLIIKLVTYFLLCIYFWHDLGFQWTQSCIPVACEELRPSCRSPASIKKHASWLIIITTSVCCLVQLGQTSREMLAAFFSFSSTSNPRGLPNPISDKSGSHCVFFGGLPVSENELLS